MDRNGLTNGAAAAGKRPAASDYNEIPYISMPIGYTHPARLAAVAHMYGLPSAPADAADVLELGCAGGGNIIPLAARFPKAAFLGIDVSQAHVAAAQQRIAALGLKNIEIRLGDLTTANYGTRRFDYVLCHGVFSWVPAAAQDAIFRICRDSMSDRGIAAVSYNVLPGWHQRRIVRDICLMQTRGEMPAEARVAKARHIIAELAAAVNPANPYGHLLQTEAARLKTLPASYILGELLAPDNTPFTFSEFTERAARFGLNYVSECDLTSTYPETFAPKAATRIRALADKDAHALQSYTDVFSGRTFRRSLLARQRAGTAQPPAPTRLNGLHIASYLKRSGKGPADSGKFKDQHGRIVHANDPAVQGVLARLGAVFPGSIAVTDLAGISAGSNGTTKLAGILFELVLSGSATITSLPMRTGCADAAFPAAWRLARAEAKSGQPWVTSLLHGGVAVNKVVALLLPLMDGRNDRAKLQSAVSAALKAGTLDNLQSKERPAGGSTAGIEATAADFVQRAVGYLAVNGVLDAEADPQLEALAFERPQSEAAKPSEPPQSNGPETPSKSSRKRKRRK